MRKIEHSPHNRIWTENRQWHASVAIYEYGGVRFERAFATEQKALDWLHSFREVLKECLWECLVSEKDDPHALS